MVIPLSATAFAADTGRIGGDGTVVPIVVNVAVPMNLNFALDPLQVTDGASQISNTTYGLINKSNVDVAAMFYLKATAAIGVSLEANDDNIGGTLSETDKTLIFGAIGATDITGTDTAFAATALGAAIPAYDASETATIVKAAAGSDGTFRFAFALEKATPAGTPTTLASDFAGLAAFQFYGVLETYADWKAGDITVSGVYKLQPLAGDDFDGITPATNSFNMIAQVDFADTAPDVIGFTSAAGTSAANKVTVSKAVNTVNVPFYFGDVTPELKTPANAAIDNAGDKSYAVSGGNLVLKTTAGSYFATAGNGIKAMPLIVGDETFTLHIELTD
jgi:hypothetical protein